MGWLTGWAYRKSHDVNGSTAGDQVDYQIKIVVHKGAGVDAGQDVYLGVNVRDDFGDVRFTKADGFTLLDYWMESLTSGVQAVFWVEVPYIPVDPDHATIYIYYGKGDATSVSNGAATFSDFWEDFEDCSVADWTIDVGCTFVCSAIHKYHGAYGGYAIWPTHWTDAFKSLGLYSSGYKVIEFYAKPRSLGAFRSHLIYFDLAGGDEGNSYCPLYFRDTYDIMAYDGAWRDTGVNWVSDTWYKMKVVLNLTTKKYDLWINDVQVLTGIGARGVAPASIGPINLRGDINAGLGVDDIRVRKYCSPEPTHGAWGSEETSPTPPAVKIDLRVSDVDPPDPDTPKTIYRDRFNLPDPMILGITIRYFNWDDVQLYFRVTGQATGYTFTPVDLGALASGGNLYANLDQFVSRPKPAGEVEEEITLILRAYTDAAYTVLKWTYERVVHVVIIDSNDPSYTVDELDNFDDGTVQGWAMVRLFGDSNSLGVASDYVLSAPYSLKAKHSTVGSRLQSYIWKNFTTPNKNKVYVVFDLRQHGDAFGGATFQWRNDVLTRDGTVIVYLGRPWEQGGTEDLPVDRWFRIVAVLPKNTNLDVRIYQEAQRWAGTYIDGYLWMDDFKIISKD